jgi:hypothetical protein
MAAPDRPIAKAASADQVAVRPDADDFPGRCQVPDRDSHPSASVVAPEERPVAHQVRRLKDAHPHSALDAHQGAGPPEVARVVVVAKVVGQERERSASKRHQQAKVWMDATERPVARSASQWGALQVQLPALPPREPRSEQQERTLALWEPQLPESLLAAPWQEQPQAPTVLAQRAQQPVKVPQSRV